jgi:hypothetical protein
LEELLVLLATAAEQYALFLRGSKAWTVVMSAFHNESLDFLPTFEHFVPHRVAKPNVFFVLPKQTTHTSRVVSESDSMHTVHTHIAFHM